MPFEKWRETFNKSQEPFHELTVLNIKTLEGLTYLKPENLANFKNPEELLDKQINIAFENAHKILDHMQQSCLIIEKAMLSLVPEAKK
jgi:hypothetical protein